MKSCIYVKTLLLSQGFFSKRSFVIWLLPGCAQRAEYLNICIKTGITLVSTAASHFQFQSTLVLQKIHKDQRDFCTLLVSFV